MYVDKEKDMLVVEGVSQDTLPDLNGGNYDDRTDKKWAHPELQAMFEGGAGAFGLSAQISAPDITVEERLKRKAAWQQPITDMPLPDLPVERSIYMVKGLNEGDEDIKVYVVRPSESKRKKSPVLFAFGQSAMMLNVYNILAYTMETIAIEQDVTVVFPEARTAMEAPYPAALDDYQAVYQWMIDNAKELKINPNNVVVRGDSGGGYTALCFAFRCKRVGFKPKGFHLVEPITDNSMKYPSSRIIQGGWDAADNHRIFSVMLGKNNAYSPFLTPEQMPNNATVEQCRGLAPIFIHAMELDADRDASMDFARKLYEAKVYTQIHVWGGVAHGTFAVPNPESKICEAFQTICSVELHDMFTYDFRRSWLDEEN